MDRTRSTFRINSEYRQGNPRSFLTIKRLYLFLSALMIIFLGKIMLIDGSSIRINAYNPRLAKAEENYIRGSIYDASGNRIAYTEVASDGTKTRVYPYGEVYAHITGYSLRSKTNLELKLNEKLLSSNKVTDQLKYLFGGDMIYGNSAVLTIDGDLQQYAYSLLNGHRGAIIVSEPKTGKILALVSTPSYDPNTVAENWDELMTSEDSPLYSRAMQGQYPPGSTFKIITSLAAYRTGDLRNYHYTCTGSVELGRTTLPCFGNTAHGEESIADAFAHSCNTYFATLGLQEGGDAIRSAAESLYINKEIDFILPQSTSRVVVSGENTTEMIGETAIGQGESMITPFTMNMIASIIANGGMLYSPYLVDRIIDTEGETVEKYLPSLYDKQVISPDEASYLEDLMKGVIDYGTAYQLASLPCTVYGKTGTAEVEDHSESSAEPHTWFTGYTKVDGDVDVAVTVMIENASQSYPAVPVVYNLLSYYYSK